MRKAILLLFVALSLMSAKAQDDLQYRLEVGAGVGMVSYEGDFNGNILKGMQPMATVVGRYVIDPYKALKLGVSFGKLKGEGSNVASYYPDYQDNVYTFNNSLVDASVVYEYNFWPYGTGHDYRGAKHLSPFIFGGLGATFVSGGGNHVTTANIPLGLGVKYKAGERLNVILDWAMHFSLSDRLDGVKDPYGVKSSGLFKNTDCYSALQLTLTYSFSAKCKTCNKEL